MDAYTVCVTAGEGVKDPGSVELSIVYHME